MVELGAVDPRGSAPKHEPDSCRKSVQVERGQVIVSWHLGIA
eukprot:SAG31_NODE_37244_length_306_cov_0.584541_1_plen_41_part_01